MSDYTPFDEGFDGMAAGRLPEPPLDPEVTLQGYTTIDLPIDWMSEDWALPLDDAVLGVHQRLLWVSLRQSPSGSIPGDIILIRYLLTGNVDRDALDSALDLWVTCSDGRRYWPRLVPVIESAWARYKGKQGKDAARKRKERMSAQLRLLGLTEDGSRNQDVIDAVWAQMVQGARISLSEVRNAAMAAGVIGSLRSLGASVTRTVLDSPRTVLDSSGQLQDSLGQSRTVGGQFSDCPLVPDRPSSTKSSATRR